MQNLITIKEPSWPVGYNDKLKPEELPEGRCALVKNCFLEKHKIIEATGCSLIANDTGENKPILGLGILETSTGVKHLLKANNTSDDANSNVFYWTGSGNWTKLTGINFTAGANFEFEQAANKTYIVNGTDTPASWDGTTLSAVSAFPVTKYIKWFHNYMFAIGNPTNPARLYFSNVGAPETWGATDYIDINPNDGDTVTGLAVLKDELIISKQKRLWAFTGWTSNSFTVKDINERLAGYGSVSHRSFVNVGNDLLFLSYAGDIPHFRSLMVTQYAVSIYGGIISDDIEGTMSGLSMGQLAKTVGFYDGRRVWFFVPNGSSTYNDLVLVYDVITKGWTQQTGKYASCVVSSAVSGSPVTYFGDSRSKSRVYKLDSSNSNDGDSIPFEFKSRLFQPDMKRKIKWKYLKMVGEAIGNVNVGVETSPTGYTYDSQGNFNLKVTSGFPITFPSAFGTPLDVRKTFNLAYPPQYMMQLRLTKNDTATRAVIKDYQFLGYPKPIRSGS